MSTSKNPPPSPIKTPARQSDIVIKPDGTVFVSFLWDDLRDLKDIFLEPSHSELAPDSPQLSARTARPTIAPQAFPVDEYQSCRLCPKQCGFNRTTKRHASCGDSLLRIGTTGLSIGDEPSISGTRGSGVVMLSGCPLKCPSCHNPEMVAEGRATTIEEFIEIAFTLRDEGAHNLQILSPTVHLPALRIALRELKRVGYKLPVVFKSSGYESVSELRKLEGLIDVYLPDLKFGPCSAWGARAGVRNYFEVASEAIHEMIRQTGPLKLDADGVATQGVLVRHVKAPLPETERERLIAFLKSLPPGVESSISENFVMLE